MSFDNEMDEDGSLSDMDELPRFEAERRAYDVHPDPYMNVNVSRIQNVPVTLPPPLPGMIPQQYYLPTQVQGPAHALGLSRTEAVQEYVLQHDEERLLQTAYHTSYPSQQQRQTFRDDLSHRASNTSDANAHTLSAYANEFPRRVEVRDTYVNLKETAYNQRLEEDSSPSALAAASVSASAVLGPSSRDFPI
jgi:hypothetical protein